MILKILATTSKRPGVQEEHLSISNAVPCSRTGPAISPQRATNLSCRFLLLHPEQKERTSLGSTHSSQRKSFSRSRGPGFWQTTQQDCFLLILHHPFCQSYRYRWLLPLPILTRWKKKLSESGWCFWQLPEQERIQAGNQAKSCSVR